MLDFTQLDRVDADTIIYAGEYLYTITRDRFNLAVIVEDIDENGDAFDKARYTASSLSTALAIVERLEAGEPE